MWIFLWFLVSAFILGVFFWSLQTLLRQKKAWQAFAVRHKLTYEAGAGLMGPPVVLGQINNIGFDLHTERVPTADVRGERFSIIIELALRQGIPGLGAIGTPGALPLIERLDVTEDYRPGDADWDPAWVGRTRDVGVLGFYMTERRREILKKIFRMKILAAVLLYDEQDIVLRIETADPLNDPERLEKIVKGLLAQFEQLRPDAAEMQYLQSIKIA